MKYPLDTRKKSFMNLVFYSVSLHCLEQGCQTQFLEDRSPAPTHKPCSFQISLNDLISWIRCVDGVFLMSFALVLKKTSWYRRRYSSPFRVKALL